MMVKKMATNSAIANYQEIIDFSTTPSKVGVFGIHTPNTLKPIQMLEGFFRQFRQYKYLGCDVKIQPAATLPMDPLGVSFEAGEVATDPRDLLNPLIFKGCHGETINDALDVAYRDNSEVGSSLTRTDLDFEAGSLLDEGQQAYYSALSDPSFRKFSPLQPFALRKMHPLVHQIVGTMPIYPAQTEAVWYNSVNPGESEGNIDTASQLDYFTDPTPTAGINSQLQISAGPRTRVGDQLINGTVFTSKMERLGWLDTVSRPQADEITVTGTVASSMVTFNKLKADYPPVGTGYKFNLVPKLFMGVLLTPPCYKSILTFRMAITHHFAFRGFSTARYTTPYGHTDDYTEAISDVATASASLDEVDTTSLDVVNGDASVLTEGVY